MFRDKHGLITKLPDGVSGENSFLWTIEFLVAKLKQGDSAKRVKNDLRKAVDKMYLGNGLYKQHPDIGIDPNNKDSYMSHDQLTALVVYFSITDQKEKIKEIVSAFKFGSYNNVDRKYRPFHPRDLIFYNIMAGGFIGWLFLPLLWLITLYTFSTKYKVRNNTKIVKTDGEILYYIKRHVSNCFKPIDWFCNIMIKKRFGSWQNVFKEYFKHDEHPLNLVNHD